MQATTPPSEVPGYRLTRFLGAGAFGQRSLGITVFGGMLAALLVGTYFIPGFYVIVQGLRERVKARLGVN